MRPHTDALLEAADLPEALLRFARTLQAGVLSGPVLGMRRLVAAEAERFPDVAADYVERSWDRNQRLLADALAELAARGHLVVDDPDVAAEHLTWLVLAGPLNRLTLQAGTRAPDEESLRATAQQAVTTFLTRFGA